MESYVKEFLPHGTNEISHRLEGLFQALNSSGIRYTLWKSLENLHFQLNKLEGDIDLLVAPQEKSRLKVLLSEQGFFWDRLSPSNLGREVVVFRGYDEQKKSGVMLHVYFSLRMGLKVGKVRRFRDLEGVLDRSEMFRGINFVSEQDFYILRVLGNYIKGGRSDPFALEAYRRLESYRFHNFALSAREPDEALDQMIFFALRTSPLEKKDALQDGDLCQMISNDRKQVPEILSAWGRHLLLKLRVRNKTGFSWIVLVGPDGVGKTSTALEFESLLQGLGKVVTVYLGRSESKELVERISERNIPRKVIKFQLLWLKAWTSLLIFSKFCFLWISTIFGYIAVSDRGLIDEALKFEKSKYRLVKLLGDFLGQLSSRKRFYHFLLSAPSRLASDRATNVSAAEIDFRNRLLVEIMTRRSVAFTLVKTSGQNPSAVAAEIIRHAQQRSIMNK